jgi:tRNA pseudouridine32 synthase/23S rRNA pseudouridine746 synthase
MDTVNYRPPCEQEHSVLYLSKQLIVVDKPSGLLTVPGRGSDKADCLLSRVQVKFPDAMIVHRLDMATSGIVVMGRGPKVQRTLSILFQERKVRKRYEALVDGHWISATEGEINLPLNADWPNRPRQKIDRSAGRPSLTRYRIISTDTSNDVSRVELMPVTGRTHQLRVHMESMGHPILGDALYGSNNSRSRADRLMLHACYIEFADPATGELICLSSRPPF